MGSGNKARVKAVRQTTFMRVVPTDRPTFVQVLKPERLIPLEATAGGPAIRKATGLLPLLSGRPEPPAFVDPHLRSSAHRLTPAAGVKRSRRRGAARWRRKHGGKSGAPALRAVRVCDGSAGGGKTAASGEREHGTAVVGHEKGRRHLGTVPRDGDPCLASCLATSDRW